MRSFNFAVTPPPEIHSFLAGPGPAVFVLVISIAFFVGAYIWVETYNWSPKVWMGFVGSVLFGLAGAAGLAWNIYTLVSHSDKTDASYGMTAVTVAEWADENYQIQMEPQQAMDLVYGYDLASESKLVEYGTTSAVDAEGNVVEVQLVKAAGVFKLISAVRPELPLPE